jgi:hypothetical protein
MALCLITNQRVGGSTPLEQRLTSYRLSSIVPFCPVLRRVMLEKC